MTIDITRLSPHAQKQIREEQARRAAERQARQQATVSKSHEPEQQQSPVVNKWEMMYSYELMQRKLNGEIQWFGYESIKLRLAKATTYTPDFVVVLPDGRVEFHEVKGFWRDDARVKIKVAAELFPWARFVVVTRKHGEFKKEAL